jgi:hypothetical protein
VLAVGETNYHGEPCRGGGRHEGRGRRGGTPREGRV